MEPPIPRDQPPQLLQTACSGSSRNLETEAQHAPRRSGIGKKKNGVQTSTTTASAPVLEQEADLDAPAGKRSDGGGK